MCSRRPTKTSAMVTAAARKRAREEAARELAQISKVASTGFVRGKFQPIARTRGGAAPAMALVTEHLHEHALEAETFFAEEAEESFEAQMLEIRDSVEAAVNPVAGMVEALGASLLQRTAVAQTKAGQARELQAKRAAEARMKGYEGDACGGCGNFTLVRNGTCMKCNTCGSTSGCS